MDDAHQVLDKVQNFTAVDGAVLAAYLAGTIVLGVWLGGKQKDSRDYFVGSGEIPWWAILFSVVATETSALTFISIPAISYRGNLTFIQLVIGYLVGRIVVCYTLLPRYFDGEMVTAYALLERRFGLGTRRFASVIFMATRSFGDSVRIFATAIPVAMVLKPVLPEIWVTPAAILILGALTLLCTYFGGVRAVVWTDVVQTVVYLMGAVAAFCLLGQLCDGGWSGILSAASEQGKLQAFDFSFKISEPYTFFAGVIGGGFLSMASHGADQLIVQRLLASKSLREARFALIGSGIFVIVQMLFFLLIGIGLNAFYRGQEFTTPDAIFSTFVIEQMPVGLKGLIIAAVLAMSTAAGSINSLSAATLHDLYLPLSKNRVSPEQMMRLSKIFTVIWAAVLLGSAMLYKSSEKAIVEIALSIASFTYGGLLGGFFLAMFLRRASQIDAIIGMSAGIATMTVIVFADLLKKIGPLQFLENMPKIAWPWYVLIGTTITFSVGAISSLVSGASKKA